MDHRKRTRSILHEISSPQNNRDHKVSSMHKRYKHDDTLPHHDQYIQDLEQSQNLFQTLGISQAETEIQTSDGYSNTSDVHLILKLHHDVINCYSANVIEAWEKKGLLELTITSIKKKITLGRDTFIDLPLLKNIPELFFMSKKLSRNHCVIEYNNVRGETFCYDNSMNGIRVGPTSPGTIIGKGERKSLEHGDIISLFAKKSGQVLLAYVVEDPIRKSELMTRQPTPIKDGFLPLVNNTLGILLSSPLVGRAVDGHFHPMEVLDLRREYKNLTDSLRSASKMATRRGDLDEIPRDIHVRLEFATSDTLRNMLTIGCRALHFAGHGNCTQLYLEDGCAGVHPVAHENLASLLAAGGKTRIRLAFVSACSSAPVAKAFVSIGVKHVVAVKLAAKIEDEAAIEFTKAFYLATASGQSVNDSFHIAKQAVANSPRVRLSTEASEKFQLLPMGADHSEIIFPKYSQKSSQESAVRARDRHTPSFPALCPQNVPAVCQGFSNRCIEIYNVCLLLMRQPMNQEVREKEVRILTIIGQAGVGKSNVVFASARYICERRRFVHGVHTFHVDKKISSHGTGSSIRSVHMLDKMLKSHLENLRSPSVTDYALSCEDIDTLLVLDGMDDLVENASINHVLNECLSTLLIQYSGLKVVMTSRTKLTNTQEIPHCFEHTFVVKNFTPMESATCLLNLTPRRLNRTEMRKSSYQAEYVGKKDTTVVLQARAAGHPALLKTCGNPRKIQQLALRLNANQLDELVE